MKIRALLFCLLLTMLWAYALPGCGANDDDDDNDDATPVDDDVVDDDAADDDTVDDDIIDDDVVDDDVADDDTADDDTTDDDTTDDDTGDDDTGDDDTSPQATMGRFDPTESDGFYSLPFPIDLRLKEDGTIRITDFPNPRNSFMLRRYLAVGERDNHGWGADSGIFFTFTGEIDPANIPADTDASIEDDAAVFIVSIDPSAPDYGQRYPFQFKYTKPETVYAPANLLALLPLQGVPMLHGTTYATVMTTAVTDAEGAPLTPNPELQKALAGTSDNMTANEIFAPLADYLYDIGLDQGDVALATVFTTLKPVDRMIALRDHAYSYDLPGIDPETLEVTNQTPAYYELNGEVTIPIYQEGQVPYLLTGGAIFFDEDGVPIVQDELTTRLAITVPKGEMPADGWPLLIYSHGSGGSWRSFISQGVANWLALKGIAAASIDAPHHGPRNPISDDSSFESFCFYNALNPESFRDNNAQAATELMTVLRQMLELSVPTELTDAKEDASFDPDNVFFMGHSQGSTVGPLLVAVDPYVKAAYFSGAGASLIWNLLTKENPFPIEPIVQLALLLKPAEAAQELDEFHPALNVMQHMAELIDTVGFNPYFFSREVSGAYPKDVLQAIGLTDSYVGLPCHGSFTAAANMDLVEPLLDNDAWDRARFTGAELLADEGVTGNREDFDGIPMTAAAVQYPEPPSGADGHYVTFEFPAMHRRVACFFRTSIDNGIATLVDNQGDENSSCEVPLPAQ